MSCSYAFNGSDSTVPENTAYNSNNNSSIGSYKGPVDIGHLLRLRHYVNDVITPSVFLFGIVGNVVTFVVLSNRRLYPDRRQTMLERSAIFGLRALALSDLLFCAVGFPAPFLRGYTTTAADGPWVAIGVYYLFHRGAFLNLFLFTSTWFVVLVSVERYLVVCHPFHSAGMIHIRRTAAAYGAVFAMSVLLNAPLFVRFSVVRLPWCGEGCACYYPGPPYYFAAPVFVRAHKIVWSVVGTFVPLALILASNAFLVRELLRYSGTSANERRPSAVSAAEQVVALRLTVTLTAIVVCYLVMVCPSMILQLVRFDDYRDVTSVTSSSSSSSSAARRQHGYYKSHVGFQMAISMTNLTQAFKFASNFLLYCAINKNFRRTLTGLLRCEGRRRNSGPVGHEMGAVIHVQTALDPA